MNAKFSCPNKLILYYICTLYIPIQTDDSVDQKKSYHAQIFTQFLFRIGQETRVSFISALAVMHFRFLFFYTFKSVFGSAQHHSPLLVLHIMYWYILHSCMTVPRAWARPVAVHIIYSSRVWLWKKIGLTFPTSIIFHIISYDLIWFQKIIRLEFSF